MPTFKPVKFGKYLLLDKIAMGGMAELYRAKITGVKGFEKVIAIKKILPHLTTDENLIGSFIDEAKLAALLQHHNIVQIYDFGNTDDAYFIAMEYLMGKDLRHIIKTARDKDLPLPLDNALYIVAQVCAGLFYAHHLKDYHGKDLNVIHRDVGPQNVFITYEGQVKVIDFGIAKAAIQDTTTQTGSIKGKIAYMSPEQARGEAIDHRSDIFSIGILFYEIVTGERMYGGTSVEAFKKVIAAEFEPAENLKPGLPPEIYHILNTALAKKPQDRYQTACEMLTDIDSLIADFSLQPSERTLSQYMKLLFEREAEAEAAIMREAALVKYDETAASDANRESVMSSDIAGEYEPTLYASEMAPETAPQPHRKRHVRLLLLFILFCMMAAAFNFSWFPPWPEPKAATINQPVFHAVRRPVQPPPPKLAQTPAPEKPEDLIKGEKLIKAERFDEAIALFETLINHDSGMQDIVRTSYSTALQGKATRLIKTNPNKAKALLLKSISLDPRNAQGRFLLGRLYARQKDFVSAISLYQTALELDPEMAKAYFNLGYIYAINKDYKKSQEMYKKVISLSPTFTDEALFNLALVQIKLNNTDESIKNLEKAIRFNPNNKQARKMLNKYKKN